MMKMPVPSSYNDITTSRELRDHVGAVWYQRTFFVPSSWRDQRVFVRFGSVNYLAQVVSNLDRNSVGLLSSYLEEINALLFKITRYALNNPVRS